MLPGPAVPGSCLVSFHFLWAILSTSTVDQKCNKIVAKSVHRRPRKGVSDATFEGKKHQPKFKGRTLYMMEHTLSLWCADAGGRTLTTSKTTTKATKVNQPWRENLWNCETEVEGSSCTPLSSPSSSSSSSSLAVAVITKESGWLSELFALNHQSRILGHSSNPVCDFSVMEQVRLCAVWAMENWLGSSFNQIQGRTTVLESYSCALEQGPLAVVWDWEAKLWRGLHTQTRKPFQSFAQGYLAEYFHV